jgi:hypothetical protein
MAYSRSTKNIIFGTEEDNTDSDFKTENDDYLKCLHYSSMMIQMADLLIKITDEKGIPKKTIPAVISGLNNLKETEKSVGDSKRLYYGWFVMGISSHEIYSALAFHQTKLNERIGALEHILEKNSVKI